MFLRDRPSPYDVWTQDILCQPKEVDACAEGIGFARIAVQGKSRSYVSPCGRTVIKVSYGDFAYDHFSRYAQRNGDDPHMPRIAHAIMTPARAGLYVMEYLDANTLPETFRDFVIAKDLGDFASPSTKRDADRFRAAYPSFCDSLDRVYRTKPEHYANDLSRANVRMRGDTPVILDPWC